MNCLNFKKSIKGEEKENKNIKYQNLSRVYKNLNQRKILIVGR